MNLTKINRKENCSEGAKAPSGVVKARFTTFRKVPSLQIKIFAVFVIYMFMTAGVSVEVGAENGFPTGEGGGYDYTKFTADNWKTLDFTSAQVTPEAVDQNLDKIIAAGRLNDVPKAKLAKITDAAKIKKVVTEFTKKENRANLKKLNAGQLATGTSLEDVGDLNDVDAAELKSALIKKHGLPSTIQIAIISGVIYKAGNLINPLFKCAEGEVCGINLNSIKNSKPPIVAISAVGPTVTTPELKNGFVICRQGQPCSTLIGKDIQNMEFDPATGDLTVSYKDPKTGEKGSLKIKKGSGEFYTIADGFVFVAEKEIGRAHV